MDGIIPQTASPMVPIKNRPGLFAVTTREIADKITKGRMLLYWSNMDGCYVETISRSRKRLSYFDPDVRYVFVALDAEGHLVTEQ